ncbi:hypothetical protein PR048_023055 [Dryococelus australis]|uniref:Uncharacterized protein n=1 Tax=Dryococelus australis TaxID=614101 RepID=A0ABQ9GT23_9NEOP|nr:hypothetical protein PR048_023055 [Dryococelus australis]
MVLRAGYTVRHVSRTDLATEVLSDEPENVGRVVVIDELDNLVDSADNETERGDMEERYCRLQGYLQHKIKETNAKESKQHQETTVQVTSQMPAVRIDTSKWQFPADVKLADDHKEEVSLAKSKQSRGHYNEFMKGYKDLGHMASVEDKNETRTSLKPYYMPHHGVVKESSSTTKFRVVFNTSEKTTNEISQHLLMVGPAVQEDLHSIVLRFRMHYKIVFSADITKIYRQVQVNPQDIHLQRIIWRPSSDSHLNSYELKTVGTSSASFIVTSMDNPRDLQIDGFSDGSESAYGACIYIRSTDQNGNLTVKILCSRSRVAPFKQLSPPRLELCGAVLLANMDQKISGALKATFSQVRLDRFDGGFSMAKGTENPADIISRGTEPRILKDSELWWYGPHRLRYHESEWPKTPAEVMSEEYSKEQRGQRQDKLQWVTAYCLRFIHNCKNKDTKRHGNLKPRELSEAAILCIKQVQAEVFQQEVHDLLSNQMVSNKSSFKSLSPFLDGRELPRHFQQNTIL